jgi:hypothetical protein
MGCAAAQANEGAFTERSAGVVGPRKVVVAFSAASTKLAAEAWLAAKLFPLGLLPFG